MDHETNHALDGTCTDRDAREQAQALELEIWYTTANTLPEHRHVQQAPSDRHAMKHCPNTPPSSVRRRTLLVLY